MTDNGKVFEFNQIHVESYIQMLKKGRALGKGKKKKINPHLCDCVGVAACGANPHFAYHWKTITVIFSTLPS